MTRAFPSPEGSSDLLERRGFFPRPYPAGTSPLRLPEGFLPQDLPLTVLLPGFCQVLTRPAPPPTSLDLLSS